MPGNLSLCVSVRVYIWPALTSTSSEVRLAHRTGPESRKSNFYSCTLRAAVRLAVVPGDGDKPSLHIKPTQFPNVVKFQFRDCLIILGFSPNCSQVPGLSSTSPEEVGGLLSFISNLGLSFQIIQPHDSLHFAMTSYCSTTRKVSTRSADKHPTEMFYFSEGVT